MAGLIFNPHMIAEPRALKGGTFTPPAFAGDVGGGTREANCSVHTVCYISSLIRFLN